jgi:FixJ family two-component response regulator
MEASPIVYVVDDDEDVRTALARLLASAGENVVAFGSPAEFLDGFDRAACACLVLDVAMPGVDGLELQRIVEGEGVSMPIVFLTGHGDVTSSVQAMKRGALDFLQKPVDDDVLLAAVAQALAKAQALRIAGEGQRRVVDSIAALTPREREVLAGIVAGRLNKQIAGDLGTVEKTIKFHRGNLMRKLNVRTVADLVRIAERAGIGKRDSA